MEKLRGGGLWGYASNFFPGDHLICFQIFRDGLIDDLLRKCPVVARMGSEPVAGELFVEGRLTVARLIAFCRPEAGAVRCEHLVADHEIGPRHRDRIRILYQQ